VRRLYVESNFVLELVFSQQRNLECEQLLNGAEAGEFSLVVPSYCLGEPLETVGRRHSERRHLQERVQTELRQLERSTEYGQAVTEARAVTELFARSTHEDRSRLEDVYRRIARAAELEPLTAPVVGLALDLQTKYDLGVQDAFVLATIVRHLSANRAESGFVTTNSKDFDDPELRRDLDGLGCRLRTGFGEAVGFALHGT
jgi:predicted nucleic acid-binding protein